MGNSLSAPEVDAVVTAAKQGGLFPSPADWRDSWMYFLVVDRFNRPGSPPNHQPFDDPWFKDYQGGSLSGIAEQLPYLKDLGVGAIWLSPVLKNLPFRPTYHGYGIHDFLHAEPRFADDPANADDELRALVDAAHAHGIYVVMDIVLNHTGDAFAYDGVDQAGFSAAPRAVGWRDATGTPDPAQRPIEQIPDLSPGGYVWPQELQFDRFFRRQGVPEAGGDDTIGDFETLKQMSTVDTDLQDLLIRAYQYVIARYDVDGFRIDTLRFLKGNLPQVFGNAIREYALEVGKKNFFTFGEVFDADAEHDIARFIGRNTSSSNDLVGVDAALDYPLFNSLKPVVKGLAAPRSVADMFALRKSVERDVLSSHGDATRFFVTFLDNHDVKERLRYVDPADPHRFDQQVSLGLACLASLPGIPCLYYGTEQGLHGRGNDEAVREALWGGPGFDRTSPFFLATQAIIAARNDCPALRYGRFYFRPLSGDGTNFGVCPYEHGVLAFSRILTDDEVLVVANTDAESSHDLDVVVDQSLAPIGSQPRLIYSNAPAPSPSGLVRNQDGAVVYEVDGTLGGGAVHVVHVRLAPMEVQILALWQS